MAKKKAEKSLDELLEEALVKEDEQPYEVPGNWVWVKFDTALLNVTSSQKKLKQKKYSEIGNIPVVDQGAKLIGGHTTQKDLQYDGELPVIIFGDHTRIVKFIDFVFVQGADGVKVLLPRQIFVPEFIYYFLKNLYIPGMGYRRHFKFLTDASFSLPPLPEQKRIVKKLSSMLGKLKEARELIWEAKDTFEKRRAAILNKAFTGELTKKWREENPGVELELSKIQEIEKKPFDIPADWKWAKLQDVCSRFQYGTSAKSSKEGKVPVVRMGNIQNGIISWGNLVYTSNDKEIDQYNLNYNDVLFNRTNSPALVGKTAIYKGEMPAIYAGYLIRVKPQDKLNADFLNFFLNSPYARYKCNRVKTDGVSQSNINSKKLGNFEIPLPPLEEQKEIVRILENLLDHEDKARALIDMEEHIDLLEKSILSKAFRGELGTNDPNDEPAIELLKRSLKGKMNK